MATTKELSISDEKIMNEYPSPTKKQAIELAEKTKEILSRKFVLDSLIPVDNTLTNEERLILERYEGLGSIKGIVDRGILHQYYTPFILAKKMWELAYLYGIPTDQKISVIEPSAGTGRFFKFAPENSELIGFDTDKINNQITKLLYPNVLLNNIEFETAFLQPPHFTKAMQESWMEKVDLVIGNPPYGDYKGYYSSYMPKTFKRFEFLFVYLGLKLLKKNGLLIFVVSQNFMNNGGMYNKMKEEILKLGSFVTAFRLPNGVFSSTEVGTDIVIFRRK